jgi:hypothetical protein
VLLETLKKKVKWQIFTTKKNPLNTIISTFLFGRNLYQGLMNVGALNPTIGCVIQFMDE